MRQQLILLVIIISCFVSVTTLRAQEQIVAYYDEHMLFCKKETAKYVFVYERKGDKYSVTEGTLNDDVLMRGTVTKPRGNYSRYRDGMFTFYAEEGYKKQEGSYVAGLKEGKWISYSKTGTVNGESEYAKGKQLYSKIYDDTTGRLKLQVFYTAGLPDSVIEYAYYDGGRLKRKTIFGNGSKERVFRCFTISGVDTLCNSEELAQLKETEKMPSPPFDMMRYLSESIVYPESALINNEQGRVMVSFIVNEDGSISDVAVADGVSQDLDKEAVRVVMAMPKWKPGMQFGKPVRVHYTQPITFKLQ
jgi:TonB family protein